MEARKDEFESTCKLFIDSVTNYFSVLTEQSSEISVPYLKDIEKLELKQFTGMIGVSGNRKGYVYFSADRELFEELINIFVGIDDPEIEDVMDMAGEISNVIAGNIRANLGTNFIISVPLVFEGRPDDLKFPDDTFVYVIPITWNGHNAYVVVGLH
ncbi:MAG: chemotaxis protein CheX [Bacteroidota bacterium]